uniref:Uncharacterized protein n=1 Tax=Cucumis melo TaxID=3656 RepID=A0A9I9EEH8_CUCME
MCPSRLLTQTLVHFYPGHRCSSKSNNKISPPQSFYLRQKLIFTQLSFVNVQGSLTSISHNFTQMHKSFSMVLNHALIICHILIKAFPTLNLNLNTLNQSRTTSREFPSVIN